MQKMRRFIPVLLLLGFLFSGSTKASAQQANIYVILSPGADAYWNITFTNSLTWAQYTFLTDPSYAPTGYLGYIPPANYNIHFTGFNYNTYQYSIGNNAYQGGQFTGNYADFWDVPIINVTTISVQAVAP